jgi:hypothetical protein
MRQLAPPSVVRITWSPAVRPQAVRAEIGCSRTVLGKRAEAPAMRRRAGRNALR